MINQASQPPIKLFSSSSSASSLPEVEALFGFSQVAPKSSATTTRSRRGVARPKTRAQKELDSQLQYEAKVKEERKANKEATTAKKAAKNMNSRKENMLQLADSLSQLSSLQ